MTVESLKSFFDVVTVVLLFLTFLAGAGVLITGNIINARQATELRRFNSDLTGAKTELAQQQERAAKAEASIALAGQHAAEANAKAEGFRLAIATANERAASLELEALNLRKQLMLQGARENLIFLDGNRTKLVDALKKFSGQKVDVRRSAFPIMVNGKIASITPIGDDTTGLANVLVEVMKDSGWLLPPVALPWGIQENGISVEISDAASDSTRIAAEALVKALRDISLTVSGPTVVALNSGRFARVGTAEQAMQPVLEANTIILGVLVHPK